jgi:membrane protease YdiL (CAAX protease family)
MCVFLEGFAMFDPSDFFRFLKRPQYQSIEREKVHVVAVAIKVYLITLLFIGLINALNIIVLRTFFTLPVDETLEIPISFKEHLWTYFILVGIIAPFLEEVIFRLSLIFDPVYISLSISTLAALIVHKISNGIISIITLLLFFSLIHQLTLIYKSKFLSFWNKNFKYIFYFLSIMFGLVHIGNYNFIIASQYLMVPVLILPQLAIGFILSFTRLYYQKGFLICIIVHVLMNLVTVGVSLLQYSS